jgi:hypothetical protein
VWKCVEGRNLMKSVVGNSECGFPVFYFRRNQACLRDEGYNFHDVL